MGQSQLKSGGIFVLQFLVDYYLKMVMMQYGGHPIFPIILKNIEANRIQNTAATITIIHRPESVIHLFPHRFSSAKSLEINEINDAFAFYFSQKQA